MWAFIRRDVRCGRGHFVLGVLPGVERAAVSARQECAIEKLDGPMDFTAPFMWNGANYLLKALTDTDFIAESAELRSCLGPTFPLTSNPLLTTPGNTLFRGVELHRLVKAKAVLDEVCVLLLVVSGEDDVPVS